MSSSYVPSSTTGTPSPNNSSPTKLRSARLNDRIQKARRHRQWVAQSSVTPPSTSKSSPGSSVTSPQDRVRSKLAKTGENHLRYKKASISPAKASPDGSPAKASPPYGIYRESSRDESLDDTGEHGVEMTLSRMEQMMESPAVSPRSGDAYPMHVNHSAAEVAWPDDTSAPHPHDLSQQKPPTSSAPGQRGGAFERPSSPARSAVSRGSVSKRYAPWEKRPDVPMDESPIVAPRKMWKADSQDESNVRARSSPQSWQRPASGKKLAPWEKPRPEEQLEDPQPVVTQEADQVQRRPSPTWPVPRSSPRSSPAPALRSSPAPPEAGGGTPSWVRPDAKAHKTPTSGRKLAPWEKPRPESPPDPEPELVEEFLAQQQQAFLPTSEPARNTTTTTPSWKKPDARKLAPWEKPRDMGPEDPGSIDVQDGTHGVPRPDARAHAPPVTARRFAPWEKPKVEEFPDPEPDMRSDIQSDIQSDVLAPWEKPRDMGPEDPGSIDVQDGTHGVPRPDARAHAPPVTARRLAPWEKPKVEEFPDPEPDMRSDIQSDIQSDVHTDVMAHSVASSASSWQRPERNRFTPKQQESQDLDIQRSGSWQTAGSTPSTGSKWRSSTPTYEIGRQGSWQKPKSPSRPSPAWQKPTQQEEQVVHDDVVEQTPGTPKLAPWQVEMQRRKGHLSAGAPPSNDPPRASPVPRPPGKLPTPAWMKSPASSTPKEQPRGRPAAQQSWKRELTPTQELPKETIDANHYVSEDEYDDPPLRDLSSSPESHANMHDDTMSDTPSATTRASIGGAIIETPNPQSVASLRASLGSKPTPPPLPGTIPLGAHRSPGDSPWLAGNRKTANRLGAPHLGAATGGQAEDTELMPEGKHSEEEHDNQARESFDLPPIDYAPALAAARAATRSTQSPVPTQRNTIPDSPAKSLSEMAADSVVITDYTQLASRRAKLYEEEEDESLISSGVARNTPSKADLPPEFHDLLPQHSEDDGLDILNQASQESNTSTLANDFSPTSMALAAESGDRRRNLRDRVEDYSFDEEDEEPAVSPNRNIRQSRSAEEKTQRERRLGSLSPARKHPSEVSADALNRIRMMGGEVEGSEAGGSSAVFGAPETFGAAGGDAQLQAPPVADRARAIADWNGGVGDSPARSSTVELNSILDQEESPLRGAQFDNDRSLDRSARSAFSDGIEERGSPTRKPRGASRILKFFGAQESQEFTGVEADEWASRDPDIDDAIMRDESPSPEPVSRTRDPGSSVDHDSDVENDGARRARSVKIMTPPRPPRLPPSNSKAKIVPDPNDPFYAAGSPEKNTKPSGPLNPDEVFDSFWAENDAANETVDFDEADASFFSSTSQDAPGHSAESPFRVVQLRKPRESPAYSRERRRREASEDYDSNIARFGASFSSRSFEI